MLSVLELIARGIRRSVRLTGSAVSVLRARVNGHYAAGSARWLVHGWCGRSWGAGRRCGGPAGSQPSSALATVIGTGRPSPPPPDCRSPRHTSAPP